jgi:hypothetical protein
MNPFAGNMYFQQKGGKSNQLTEIVGANKFAPTKVAELGSTE